MQGGLHYSGCCRTYKIIPKKLMLKFFVPDEMTAIVGDLGYELSAARLGELPLWIKGKGTDFSVVVADG